MGRTKTWKNLDFVFRKNLVKHSVKTYQNLTKFNRTNPERTPKTSKKMLVNVGFGRGKNCRTNNGKTTENFHNFDYKKGEPGDPKC